MTVLLVNGTMCCHWSQLSRNLRDSPGFLGSVPLSWIASLLSRRWSAVLIAQALVSFSACDHGVCGASTSWLAIHTRYIMVLASWLPILYCPLKHRPSASSTCVCTMAEPPVKKHKRQCHFDNKWIKEFAGIGKSSKGKLI